MSLLQISVLVGFLVLGLGDRKDKPLEVFYSWKGTCVEIPCSDKTIKTMKTLNHFVLYHDPQYDEEKKLFSGFSLFNMSDSSKNNRTQFLGLQGKEGCSMRISQLQVNDSGILGLRMKTEYDKWMEYVQLNVTESAPQPHIQLPQQFQESQKVTVTCFLNYSCSAYPVTLLWSLDEQEVLLSQVKNSVSMNAKRILTESKFTFTPNWTQHGKKLVCQLRHANDRQLSERIVQLNVKHTPKLTIKANSQLEVKEGESVILRCLLLSSNPKIQGNFFWFKDGQDMQKWDENLTLTDVNWQQAGNYNCKAVNEVGQGMSKPVHLQVFYSPKLSKVLPIDLTVKENETAELTCKTTAYPSPTNYTWYQDGKQMLGETKQTLKFQEVNQQQSGQYTCLAENSEGRGDISERAMLDVQYPPTGVTVTITSQTPIREGDSVVLSCSYEQSNPPVKSYSWRPQFSSRPRTSSNVLTINNIPWNAEPVTCRACNNDCSYATPINLDVQYAPRNVKVVLLTPKADIQSGDQVQLQCDFSSSHPRNVLYAWTLNGKHLKEGRYLNWSSISPEDSGLYSCLVTNSIGQTQSQEWDLKVQYAPRHLKVSIIPSDAVMEKTSVVLICEADANPTVDLYTWFDWKGQKIDSSGRKLTFWPVMTHQSGAYWCQGTNKLGTGESHPALLTVHYSPETIGKRTALGFGVCLAILLLALMGFQFVQCWKKIRGKQDFQELPRRQGSFFIRNKKIRRPRSTAAPQSLGYYNPAVEERSNYATLQFPGAGYLETSPVSLQTENQSVTYAVVQRPHRGDYENVMPQSSLEEEGLHYSELIQFGEGGRSPVQEGVEYVTLKH